MCKTFILDSKEAEIFTKIKRGLFFTHPVLAQSQYYNTQLRDYTITTDNPIIIIELLGLL